MGFDTPASKLFDFVYKADFENGLTEYEFDHVYSGEYDGEIRCNPDEVMDYCFKPMHAIAESLQTRPGLYTAWFQLAFPKIEKWWQQQYGAPALTD
jgi:isopentenyl-diphosphate delta-isomerase